MSGPNPMPWKLAARARGPAQVAVSGQLLGGPAPFVATIGPNPKVWPNICTNLQGHLTWVCPQALPGPL